MKIITSVKITALLLMLLGLGACTKQTSEEHLETARTYLAESKNAAAILEFKNAIQLAPKSAEPRFELGRVYIEENQFENAEKELSRAMEYGYPSAKVLPLLSRAYQHTGAYSALSKVTHSESGLTALEKAEIGYLKVLALVRLDKSDEARLLIEELAQLDTSSVFKGLATAYPDVLDGNFEKALQQISLLRDQEPQNAEVLKLLAQLQLAVRTPEAAAETFKNYVLFYPYDKQTMFVLAKLLVDLGQTSEAEPYVDKLLAISPQNALLNQLKAAVRAADEDFQQALSYAEAAIQAGSTDSNLRLIAGYAAYQLQDFKSANLHLSFIANTLPDNHPGLKLLAASQLRLGLTSEVGGILDRLNQLSEQDAPLFSQASYELIRSGHVKEAKELIEKSSALSSTADNLTRLGLLQLSLNNLDGIVNLEAAVEKSPELTSAKTTLGTAYLATGQYDKALDLALSWAKDEASNPTPYMLAGQVYVKKQDYASAKEQYEKALNTEQGLLPAKMALITLELTLGSKVEAETDLQELLKEAPSFVPALATSYIVAKQNGDPQAGISQIEQAQKNTPEDFELRLMLTRVYLAEKQYSAAIALLDGFKDEKSLTLDYWKVRGQSLIRGNQREAASEHYDAWLSNFPFDKDATLGKLLLLDSANMFPQGLALTEAFLEKRDDLQMQLLRVHFLLMANDVAAAKLAYQKLPKQAVELPMVKGFLARFQLADKKPEEALPNAQIAYQASPNFRNLSLLLYTYEQLNQKEQGLTLLTQHLQTLPNDLAARMLLAERQITSDRDAAMISYELALSQNPNNYIARNNLAFLYLEAEDIQKAKEHALIAVELQPNNAAAVDTLAQVLVQEKDYDQALEHYERVIDDSMKNEEIYLNYVETLFIADNMVLGKRKLEQRTLLEPDSIARVLELKTRYAVE
ncbi:MAG: putative PEP-CTERM system TPR-repeat lipoprotein [Paraglaciecola sp.]|jgi:putative PEP-CTERM system TPR-repeat lipoprotein